MRSLMRDFTRSYVYILMHICMCVYKIYKHTNIGRCSVENGNGNISICVGAKHFYILTNMAGPCVKVGQLRYCRTHIEVMGSPAPQGTTTN